MPVSPDVRLRALQDLSRARPDDPFVWYGIAMEYYSGLGDAERAVAAFRDVLARFPDYVPAYLMAGKAFVARGDLAEARATWTRGLEAARRKGDGHAAGELAEALADLGDGGAGPEDGP